MSELAFIDPTFVPSTKRIPMATRPAALTGKVIGMVDNTKEQADVIFKTIGDALIARYGAKGVVVKRKEHYTKPASPELLAALTQEVDVAITGLGGWGSCTLCSVHDAIEFEKRGIPATVVLTSIFRNPCEYQFRSKGMEGHPYIELPHPVSQLKPDDMRVLTERYIDEVVRQLTAQ